MLTIELDESTCRELSKRAAESNVSVGELAAAQIASSYGAQGDGVSPEVHAIIAKQIETYRPLFDRLAE